MANPNNELRLILASTSPYRKKQLESLLIPFECQKPRIDEEKEKDTRLSPTELAQHLGRLKAQSLAAPGVTVIGGDQLVDFEGRVMGKPGTPQNAVHSLELLQGKTHNLVTAVTVIHDLKPTSFLNVTRIKLKTLTRAQVEAYVRADNPLDCAGSYKIEEHGLSLIEEIQTDDFTAIQGLPLLALSKVLHNLGYEIPKA